MTRIICQQLAPKVGDLDANSRLSVEAIVDAVGQGADVVVLPELVTSGYVFSDPGEAKSVSIPADDGIFDEWSREAGKGSAVVIGGFSELGDDGLIYNSAAIVDGNETLGIYRKLHLWDNEKSFFTPGSELPRVHETEHGRIGTLICYDLEFPEMTRQQALAGADLIAVPTNWPLADRTSDDQTTEVTVAKVAAYANRVFIACCDRTGNERGQDWESASSIVDQEGAVIASQDGVGSAIADVDLSLARDKTLTPLADALGDRRPDLYEDLVDVPPGISSPGSQR